ncbi:MAG: GGDEF domain-containing protein [Gammaproteobacteria bacterium]|nr:GGDEF domain-containing protein [Gammaproteobacteria bacterium]
MPIISLEQSVVTPLGVVKQQRLDVQLKQLEFHALLHRKLELDRLFECFFAEGQAFLKFDGLQFLAASRGQDVLVGDVRQHQQRFELHLGEHSLGDVVLMRAKPFNSREDREAARLVESLVYPLNNALEHYNAVLRSMTDKTTGLQNQVALEQQLPQEIRFARRSEYPLAVLLITVDYLESISEHHGSVVGDTAWQSVADALTEQLRQCDVIFRTEQDEFLMLLSHTDLTDAYVLADRLRKNVDRCVSYDNVQFVLTMSAGVTELDEADTPESLMNRVREALSLARREGRNQVATLHAGSPTGDDDPSVA